MLSKYKFYTENSLQSLAKSLSWLNPNILTLIGIIPQGLFFIFMRSHMYGWAAIALICSTIDLLDGVVARANNKVTKFGGFLDSTLDRVSDFLLITGFYYGNLIGIQAFLILLATTYLISYVRSRAELASNSTIKFDVGLIERPERIIFLFLVLLLEILLPQANLSEPLVWILIILSIYTLTQRIWYAYKKL